MFNRRIKPIQRSQSTPSEAILVQNLPFTLEDGSANTVAELRAHIALALHKATRDVEIVQGSGSVVPDDMRLRGVDSELLFYKVLVDDGRYRDGSQGSSRSYTGQANTPPRDEAAAERMFNKRIKPVRKTSSRNETLLTMMAVENLPLMHEDGSDSTVLELRKYIASRLKRDTSAVLIVGAQGAGLPDDTPLSSILLESSISYKVEDGPSVNPSGSAMGLSGNSIGPSRYGSGNVTPRLEGMFDMRIKPMKRNAVPEDAMLVTMNVTGLPLRHADGTHTTVAELRAYLARELKKDTNQVEIIQAAGHRLGDQLTLGEVIEALLFYKVTDTPAVDAHGRRDTTQREESEGRAGCFGGGGRVPGRDDAEQTASDGTSIPMFARAMFIKRIHPMQQYIGGVTQCSIPVEGVPLKKPDGSDSTVADVRAYVAAQLERGVSSVLIIEASGHVMPTRIPLSEAVTVPLRYKILEEVGDFDDSKHEVPPPWLSRNEYMAACEAYAARYPDSVSASRQRRENWKDPRLPSLHGRPWT